MMDKHVLQKYSIIRLEDGSWGVDTVENTQRNYAVLFTVRQAVLDKVKDQPGIDPKALPCHLVSECFRELSRSDFMQNLVRQKLGNMKINSDKRRSTEGRSTKPSTAPTPETAPTRPLNYINLVALASDELDTYTT